MTYRHIPTKKYMTYDIKFSHIVAALEQRLSQVTKQKKAWKEASYMNGEEGMAMFILLKYFSR